MSHALFLRSSAAFRLTFPARVLSVLNPKIWLEKHTPCIKLLALCVLCNPLGTLLSAVLDKAARLGINGTYRAIPPIGPVRLLAFATVQAFPSTLER